jgi:hypothetical protein
MEAGGGVPGTGSRRQLLQIAQGPPLASYRLARPSRRRRVNGLGLFGDDTDPLREAFIKLLPHHAPDAITASS